MIVRKGKYTPGKVYNSIKEKMYKNWESKSELGFNSNEEIPKFTNYDISDRNTRCDIFIKELWHDTSKNLSVEEIKFCCEVFKQT